MMPRCRPGNATDTVAGESSVAGPGTESLKASRDQACQTDATLLLTLHTIVHPLNHVNISSSPPTPPSTLPPPSNTPSTHTRVDVDHDSHA